MSDRLDRLTKASTPEWKLEKESNARLAYERRLVRKILTSVGISNLAVRTRYKPKWSGQENEDFFLTFGWLHMEFEIFPVRLALLLPKAGKDISQPLDDFLYDRSDLWSYWRDIEETMQDCGFPYGAVFPTGSRLGDMVMHTMPLDSDADGKELVRYKNGVTAIRVERFDIFTKRIAPVWKMT